MNQGTLDFLGSAVGDKIENFVVQDLNANSKGEGFLGETNFFTLQNKKTGKEINIVLKSARPSKTDNTRYIMTTLFTNEIQCYTKVFPALQNFQKSYPDIRKFDNYPHCYAVSLKTGFEKLVLDHLGFRNYEVYPRQVPLDTQTSEKLLQVYGELHALGFAFKHHHPQEFLDVTKNLSRMWTIMTTKTTVITNYLKYIFPKVKRYLEEENEVEILKKFDIYVNDPQSVILDCINSTEHGTIIHGDSWCNNMMVKYDKSRNIEHVELLDFQMVSVDSPVIDLSYHICSGAGKESLDNFEHLMKFYHNVLSDSLVKYGCEPEKIYSYEVFKKELKSKWKFGLFFGVLVWACKHATDLHDMTEIMDITTETDRYAFGTEINEEIFKIRTLDIVRHMHENDFL